MVLSQSPEKGLQRHGTTRNRSSDSPISTRDTKGRRQFQVAPHPHPQTHPGDTCPVPGPWTVEEETGLGSTEKDHTRVDPTVSTESRPLRIPPHSSGGGTKGYVSPSLPSWFSHPVNETFPVSSRGPPDRPPLSPPYPSMVGEPNLSRAVYSLEHGRDLPKTKQNK